MQSRRSLFTAGLLALAFLGLHAACGDAGGAGEAPSSAESRSQASTPPRASERPRGAILRYDTPAEQVTSRSLGTEVDHDVALARVGEQLWTAWLEYVPPRGDRLLVARLVGGERRGTREVVATPGFVARPRLTPTADGALWLSWEERRAGPEDWDVLAGALDTSEEAGGPLVAAATEVSSGSLFDGMHDVAAAPDGGLWFAWRTDAGGRFAVATRRLPPERDGAAPATLGPLDTLDTLDTGDEGAWDPRLAVAADGTVALVYERVHAGSFDVHARLRAPGATTFGPTIPLAQGPGLEYHPRVLALPGEGFLCAWEVGGEGWGAPFSLRKEAVPGAGRPSVNDVRQERGPLHRERRLEFLVLAPDGTTRALAAPFPMPAFAALAREAQRPGSERLGGFYERAELVLDGAERAWVVWRHYAVPGLGVARFLPHHVFDEGWRLYARAWTAAGWSPLVALDAPQRDGEQSLAVSPEPDGLALLWEVGRRDRYHQATPSADPRDPAAGLHLAQVAASGAAAPLAGAPATVAPARPAAFFPPVLAPAEVGGQTYEVAFGDLHRHTDVSLCNAFLDGTLDDTYRYAIEVTHLDFLAITDHTWDVDQGHGSGLTWWRGTAEVSRHRLAGRFAPLHGFERSSRNTDHNFITLREDLIFEHLPQARGRESQGIEELWSTLGDRTLTLPHQPFRGDVWEVHDEVHRPLMEVYQGFRSADVLEEANKGLDRGHRFGFVASSDHLSTSASYACAWTTGPDEVSVFDALRTRRAYAATDRIRLVFRAGDAWMGSRLEGPPPAEFAVEVDGTAALREVRFVVDGEVRERRTGEGAGAEATRFRGSFSTPGGLSPGEHWAYVQVVQADGGGAWASPIWFQVGP